MMQDQPKTLFAKVWGAHVVETDGDQDLLWIDRHFVHEGSFHAFGKLEESGRGVRHPELTFGVADHYVPSDHSAPPKDAEVANMIDLLTRNTSAHGIDLFAMGDARQGIVHVAAPEQGLSLPGLTIVCGDSHTATHGAFGAFAFGIGASEVAHVLATQTLWQKRPKVMRITVDGVLDEMTSAKDLALYIISRIGTGGATGHVVEYDGSAIRALSMEGRMTLCNMTIEAGARAGMVAPDETTVAWLERRPFAPKGADMEAARADWAALRTDDGARFDKELRFDAADVGPMVTWGTSPEEVASVTASVPREEHLQASRDYMGLEAGQEISGIAVDQVFIGSCTNSRIQDLREAASVLRLGRVTIPTMIVPGSAAVKKAAEAEGLDRIFLEAGAQWRDSGCSMCVAMNGDAVAPGKRCASTSNRNFPGRQGRGARTHLMSPAMAAAAALTGHIVDVRTIGLQTEAGAGR